MKKIVISLILLFTFYIKAQPPLRFYTKFGGNGDDIGYSAKETLDRHFIVVGSTSSYGSGATDVYLVKIDSMGYPLISKTFGGIGSDIGKSVIQLPDSGYVIAGFTSSYGAGGYDAYVIRTDKNCDLVWEKTFGGLNWDFANDLVLASDGNIMVVGNTNSFGAGKKDGFVLKYDLAGNMLWQKMFGGSENEELRAIIKTNDNFLATVGYTESKNDINGDGYFLKLDLNGDTLFTKTYGGPFKDYANDVVQKSNNEYVICGAETFSANSKTHSSMYSITSTGSFTWQNNYYASSDDEDFVSLSNSYQRPDLTGYLRNVPVPGFNVQGNIFVGMSGGWSYLVNSFGGGQDETFYSIEGTKDGGFLSVGSTISFNSVGLDVFLIKEDSTIINYSSVIGIKKNNDASKPVVFYESDHLVSCLFPSENAAKKIQLINLSGSLLQEYPVTTDRASVDMFDLPGSIYFLRIVYANGEVYHTKVIRR